MVTELSIKEKLGLVNGLALELCNTVEHRDISLSEKQEEVVYGTADGLFELRINNLLDGRTSLRIKLECSLEDIEKLVDDRLKILQYIELVIQKKVESV